MVTSGRTFRRGKQWWMAWRFRGKEYRTWAGSTEKEARAAIKAKLAEVHVGAFVPEQERLLVSEMLDRYLANRELAGKKSLRKMRHVIGVLKARLGDWRVPEVTLPALEAVATAWLEAGAAPGTVKLRLAFLRAAFEITRRQGLHRLAPAMPTIGVQNTRRGFFTAAEFEAVRHALPDYLKDVALFAYLTGWRKEEILGLQWAEVDRTERVIRLGGERTKNGHGKALPLSGLLPAILERRWSARAVGAFITPYVFHRDGRPMTGFGRAWRSACAEAGVPERFFHDLRRTAIRNLVRAGVPETVAMRISGHRTRSVFDRYNIASDDDMRSAMERVSEDKPRTVVRTIGG